MKQHLFLFLFSVFSLAISAVMLGGSPVFAQADINQKPTGSFRDEHFFQKPVGEISGPVVVELFTSQSCSSCPAADAFIQEVTERYPHVIALSCHVTYWNYLHWKDTLSKEFCSKRQRAYSKEYKTARVFTPELRVNGRVSVVGSDEDAVYRAIGYERNRVANIAVKKIADGIFEVGLPALFKKDYLVEVVYFGKDEMVSIPSGENAGRTVSYQNPVRKIDVLDDQWGGEQKTLQLNITDLEADGFVVLAHGDAKQTGTITAAGQYKF